MKKRIGLFVAAVALISIGIGIARFTAPVPVQAQNQVTQQAFGVPTSVTTCPLPAANSTLPTEWYCPTGSGQILCSNNGAAWVACPLATSTQTAITGINICNAAGTSCSTAAVTNGVVTLDIPKTFAGAAQSPITPAGTLE